jgi:hypothetical protein
MKSTMLSAPPIPRRRSSLASAVSLLSITILVSGCVSSREADLRVREARYRLAASKFKPGSTRADLARLLPRKTSHR